MTLGNCIDEFIKKAPLSEPITTDEIYEYILSKIPNANKASFNASMQKYERNSPSLARFQKGIYYKKIDSPFGDSGIDIAEMVRRTYVVDGDEVIGYERGPSFMNKVGLTTQVPALTYLATMKTRYARTDPRYFLSLSKPVTQVNKENCRYLQFLDLVENKEKVNVEASNALDIMKELIKRYDLSFSKLVYFARFYQSMEVYCRLSDLGGYL